MLGWLRSLFSLLILVGLGAVAWWGHHTEWRLFDAHAAEKPSPHDEVEVLPDGRLRFTSAEAAERAGIDFAAAYPSPIEDSLTAPASVAYDATKHARISTAVAGSVWRVEMQVGATVQAGEVLALIDAPEVGRSRADLAEAFLQIGVWTRTLDTLRQAAGVVPEGRLREADTALKDARIKLTAARQRLASLGLVAPETMPADLTPEQLLRRVRFVGLPSDLAATLAKETTACLVPVVAPIAGEVLTCDLVAGEVVASGQVLFVVADPKRLWLQVAVKPDQVACVKIGQSVRFLTATGPVEWISPVVDEATRTVEVRATLDNAEGKLRVGQRSPARVVLGTQAEAILIPSEAVQVNGEAFVLVRDRKYRTSDEKILHVRRVQTGARDGDLIAITTGLAVGEAVVTKGAARLFDRTRWPAGEP